MSTNYYALGTEHPREDEDGRLHIGKSSRGWTFALRCYRDEGPASWEDWLRLLNARHVFVEDEYGDSVSLDDLVETVTMRVAGHRQGPAWYAANKACPGPYNLARREWYGLQDVVWPDGNATYDLCFYDFK